MVATIAGNIIHRPTDEQTLAIWQTKRKATTDYSDPEAWHEVAPFVTGNAVVSGAGPIDAHFRLDEQVRWAQVDLVPLPDDIAALLGPAADSDVPGAVEPQE